MFRNQVARLAPKAARLNSSSTSGIANAVTPALRPGSVAPTVAQAPNYPQPWSTSQRARADALAGPRFEQTALDLQPKPMSAMQLVSEDPIRLVHGRKAVCDGGVGPLGHPKIYINLDKPGPKACGYCGIRFEQVPHEGHGH
ncbi:ubiquinone oxidoreductase 20 kd subunit [Exidia glandulosa HHB12029]|uniref:Ubiquinone oxidoreductase 20 kd subunit n=1 Tax=Exidia glandulosa HHB12029 TaxID=1314781 RepID=A0A165PI13_EXIGL|nr:ubiquinone oxidoreductase 20 kd subunit [Exidia glandulosa HHB12029]